MTDQTITAPHYSATAQAIEDAIATSIRRDCTVEIEHLGDAGLRSDIVSQLWAECDGDSTENDGAQVFWGEDLDGAAWKISVPA